jgi:four helix bundle protein
MHATRREHVPIEDMELFAIYVEIADWVWITVGKWPPLAADTVGKQLIRASDSIGANLVEGDGRYGNADAIHFFVIARASARESRYWLRRAMVRHLVPAAECEARIEQLGDATRRLNQLITYRRRHQAESRIRESFTDYATAADDPYSVE